MAEENGAVVERKPRKSVSFVDDAEVVRANGTVDQSNGVGNKAAHSGEPAADKDVDDVTEMFKGLTKKKKSKKAKDEDNDDGADAPAADGEFDPSVLKKKKKKKTTVKVDDDGDFEAKLAEAGVAAKDDPDAEPTAEADPATGQDGDMAKGTGVWAHESTAPIKYNLLLSRFYALLHSHHPDLASSGSKSYKIPPPQCLREGNKKTIFANISEICKRMKRSDEHVTQFLFAELGTSGSVDGNKRLVIRGRFQQKQIENVLRRYIMEYVTCKTCRSPDTELNKGENRLYFVTCNSCGSRRSVAAIKTGFTAQVGKRRRQQG